MTLEELKEKEQAYLQPTYRRFEVAVDHGRGATLWDVEGKRYIDFAAAQGTGAVGCSHPKWVDAVAVQAAKLSGASNLVHTGPQAELAETLCARSGMAAAFFANSGAEGNEGMIKLARKYSFDKYGKGRGTILTLWNSFHGRTVTTLSASGREKLHQYFHPFNDGFRHAEPSMLGIEAVSGHDVCAVMLELVQGETVQPLDQDFVHDLAVLCAERDWLLLIDEVQTGAGRTGSLFCYQQYGVRPDAVSFGGGMAGGLPLGGFLAGERCRNVLGPGDHGSTFGGNPVCATAALTVLDILDDDTLAAGKEKGDYLRTGIETLELDCLGGIRGLGLMLGVEVKKGYDARELAATLVENGLLVLPMEGGLRLLPPLTITREELNLGLAILKETLG